MLAPMKLPKMSRIKPAPMRAESGLRNTYGTSMSSVAFVVQYTA